MTPKELLISARAIISSPDHWTQGVIARNAKNDAVPPWVLEACMFCADGALQRAAIVATGLPNLDRDTWRIVDTARELLNQTPHARDYFGHGAHPFVTFNDITGHASALSMFDAAIASCSEGV